MGLKFCNEAIIAFQQIWPKLENEQQNFKLSPLQVLYPMKLEVDSELKRNSN